MIFWIAVPLLTLLAIAFVVVPVLRGPEEISRARWLRRCGLALGLASLVVIPSIALYYFVGRPDLAAPSSVPAPDTAQAAMPAAGVDKMIAALKAKTQQTPDDPEAWQNLGWAYMHISRPADAALAYKHAVALAPRNGDDLSALTEATVQSGDGKISKDEDSDFGRVLLLAPADPRARFYRALYKDQQGDHKDAIADWIKMVRNAPPDSARADEVRVVVQKVAQEQGIDVSTQLPPVAQPPASTAPGPDASQVAAAQAMSPDARGSMIHGMVDGLAARLKQNPQDEDGWLRLIKARMVLGEKDQAAIDYRAARRAFSNSPAVLARLDNTAHAMGVSKP